MSLKMNKVFQDIDQFWSVELIGDVDIQTSGRLKEELNQCLIKENVISISIVPI